jgi:hypothetical protein
VGGDVVFVDPEFINVDLTIVTKLDLRNSTKTKSEVFNLIQNTITNYNSNELSKFGSTLSDVDMLSLVKDSDKSIVSAYSIKVLNKNFSHLYGTTSSSNVVFGNPLIPGTLDTSDITYGNLTVRVKDDGNGVLQIYNTLTNAIVVTNSGSIDYDKGLIIYTLPTAARITDYTGSYGTIT